MILSPYRNPAYRIPTPKSSLTPPRSPKRKRNDSSHSPPLQNDAAIETQEDQVSGSSSPRLQVAEKLKDLNIQQPRQANLPVNRPRPVQRKRLKRKLGLVEIVSSSDLDASETPVHAKYDLQETPTSGQEVAETPDCRGRVISEPSGSPVRSSEPAHISEYLELSNQEPEVAPRTAPLPSPSSTNLNTHIAQEIDLIERSVSPLPLREELTPDQAILAWQEDEITGHDIDSASGDDGEGINGIGFRPTPAIAYARRQKRKQQLSEWKAREAREARQKRFERRRGGAVEDSITGLDTNHDEMKRVVRFAENG